MHVLKIDAPAGWALRQVVRSLMMQKKKRMRMYVGEPFVSARMLRRHHCAAPGRPSSRVAGAAEAETPLGVFPSSASFTAAAAPRCCTVAHQRANSS
jgi:hypothetical protein